LHGLQRLWTVGPNPTDRGRSGTKRHLVTDARRTPLGIVLSGAERHGSMVPWAALNAIPDMRPRKPGRPRRRPRKLHAGLQAVLRLVPPVDRFAMAYDSRRCRRECRERGITPRIAREGKDSSRRLGRHRWVVGRTHAWMNRLCRPVVQCGKRDGIRLASAILGAASPASAKSNGSDRRS